MNNFNPKGQENQNYTIWIAYLVSQYDVIVI